jgi:hypothetical protein
MICNKHRSNKKTVLPNLTNTIVFNSDYTKLNTQWLSISKYINNTKNETWSERYKDYTPLSEKKPNGMLLKVFNFRNKLIDYIDIYICKGICQNAGSNNFTSDFDITITSPDGNLLVNLATVNIIKKFITFFFGDFDKYVSHVFDINFYLSDFIIWKNIKHKPSSSKNLNLSNIFLCDNYKPKSTKKYPGQFEFAFYEYIYIDKQKRILSPVEYDELVNYINDIKKIIYMKKINLQDNINLLISKISELSTSEDEIYHTQGAYIHVVLIMQKGIRIKESEELNNLLKASAVENCCFAYTHFDNFQKRVKYISRVVDALSRIKEIHLDPVFSQLYYVCNDKYICSEHFENKCVLQNTLDDLYKNLIK